jgi:hypothetical protein
LRTFILLSSLLLLGHPNYGFPKVSPIKIPYALFVDILAVSPLHRRPVDFIILTDGLYESQTSSVCNIQNFSTDLSFWDTNVYLRTCFPTVVIYDLPSE